ncbi:glycosyltransferase family 1 protein [Chroococcidiopsis sp. TS-821]|uniref:glycosyltransferase family 4 protein n=1 Tax=Chroococcidiopsis sp. TS-821 TaxID=1378066 RepID=UPI000CEE4DBA|nr:glycosyltransferase family 1 protein [Chroococcidiopsis sp. TS-821]PPS42811.1 mannosyltransferase [Chroococcidiopsis sp. TS-821]
MKILLIGNYLPDCQESMQRFADMLHTGLIQLNYEVRLLKPQPFFGKLKVSNQGLSKWLGYVDKFVLFPQTIQQAITWADIVHICDHSNSIYTKYLQRVPHVVTCHDLLAVRSALGEIKENPTKWSGRKLQQMILRGLERSQRIVCVSQQTKKDLLRITSIEPSTISVIYDGLNYPYAPVPKVEMFARCQALGIDINFPFLLHVGGNHWYKNRLGVLAVFHHLKQHNSNIFLVMVGKPFTWEMQQFIQERGLETHVKELVAIENNDLRALYSAATALLFPSLQEGFGWPIAEAQACGCPVITSNRPPMTEVAGNAAIYIDPENPKAAAQEIAQHLPTISKLKQAGFVNVQRFAPQKMLESYIDVYQEICK